MDFFFSLVLLGNFRLQTTRYELFIWSMLHIGKLCESESLSLGNSHILLNSYFVHLCFCQPSGDFALIAMVNAGKEKILMV